MLIMRLAVGSLPELVLFTKAVFNIYVREGTMDDRPTASSVAGMLAHNFSHHFLDERLELLVGWEIEVRELHVGSLKAPV